MRRAAVTVRLRIRTYVSVSLAWPRESIAAGFYLILQVRTDIYPTCIITGCLSHRA